MTFSILITLFLSLQLQSVAALPSSDSIRVIGAKDVSSPRRAESLMPAHLKNARQVNPDNCRQAAPGVNETAIFLTACVANPQNDFDNCLLSLQAYVSESSITTCQKFYGLWNGCLLDLGLTEDGNTTECSQERDRYAGCSDYTLQAYAYCGCFFTIPSDITDCANVELGIELGLVSLTTSSNPASTPTGTSSGPTAGLPTVTTTVFVTFTPGFTPTVSMLSVPTDSTMAAPPPGTGPSTKGSGTGEGGGGGGGGEEEGPGAVSDGLSSSSRVAPTTVATLTVPSTLTTLTTAEAISTSCSDELSTWACVTTRTTVDNAAPVITGYVCAGSECQNQRAGYQYCLREYSTQVMALPPPQTKREL